jgi:hypothetical protein
MIDTDNYTHTVRGLKILYTHTEMAEEVLLLVAEVKRLREGIKSYLNLEIETHELKELIE